MKRVALYARVSTGGQTVENQLRELEQVGSRIGWQVVDRYIDQGISGAKGRAERPELARMMRAVLFFRPPARRRAGCPGPRSRPPGGRATGSTR